MEHINKIAAVKTIENYCTIVNKTASEQ